MAKVDREKLYEQFGVVPEPAPQPPEKEDPDLAGIADEDLEVIFPEGLEHRKRIREQWVPYTQAVAKPISKEIVEAFPDAPLAVHVAAAQRIGQSIKTRPDIYCAPEGGLRLDRVKELALAAYNQEANAQGYVPEPARLNEYLQQRVALNKGKGPK